MTGQLRSDKFTAVEVAQAYAQGWNDHDSAAVTGLRAEWNIYRPDPAWPTAGRGPRDVCSWLDRRFSGS